MKQALYIPFRRISEGIKYILIFVAFTILFYNIITVLSNVIKPKDPYKEPEGKALKVLKYNEVQHFSYEDFKKRLFDFYYYGE